VKAQHRDTAALLLILLIAAVGVPYLLWDTRKQFRQCLDNEFRIGMACEMYSSDNAGRYPRTLSQLTPKYLKSIPTCPVAGADTYSAGFVSSSRPDWYSLVCTGWHHKHLAGPNYPQYHPYHGYLME
jgi:hypothetical protein